MKKLYSMIGLGILAILMVHCQKERLPEPQLNSLTTGVDSLKSISISLDTVKTSLIVSTDDYGNSTKANSLKVDYLKTFSASAGDNDYFILQSNTSWQISSYPSWVSISPLSGKGNAHVTVTVNQNIGAQRTGTITVIGSGVKKSSTLNVLQLAGNVVQSNLAVDWLKTFSSMAGDNDYFIITSNTSWKISSAPSWVTVSPLSGTGNARITVTVQENSGTQRTGNISITGNGVSQTSYINVIQDGSQTQIPTQPTTPIIDETIYGYPFTSFGSIVNGKKMIASSSVTGILFDYKNTTVDFENNYLESNNSGIIASLFIHDATSLQTVKINNNVIQFSNPQYYTILVGAETTSSSDNYFNGAEIIGNKVTGVGSFNSGSVSNHGIFVGFSKDAKIKYNFCSNVPYSSAVKSQNLDNSGGIIAYNIYKNSKYAVTCKGILNTKIYNNTFYSDNVSIFNYATFITLTKNEDGGAGSSGTIIKNNIFYSSGLQTMMISVNDVESLSGLQCDYNIYYRAGNDQTLVFRVIDNSGEHYYTFAQWQALGFDKHSVIMDPKLDTNTLIPATPILNAIDLGSNYNTGIDVSNTWNRTSTITKTQGNVWQNGAFIK